MFRVADRDSERHLKKFFKKLIGKKGIEDALSKLDRLTQEEVNMATVQILKVSHYIKGGVEAVGVEVKQLIEGTFGALASHKYHPLTNKRPDGKELKARMEEEKR